MQWSRGASFLLFLSQACSCSPIFHEFLYFACFRITCHASHIYITETLDSRGQTEFLPCFGDAMLSCTYSPKDRAATLVFQFQSINWKKMERKVSVKNPTNTDPVDALLVTHEQGFIASRGWSGDKTELGTSILFVEISESEAASQANNSEVMRLKYYIDKIHNIHICLSNRFSNLLATVNTAGRLDLRFELTDWISAGHSPRLRRNCLYTSASWKSSEPSGNDSSWKTNPDNKSRSWTVKNVVNSCERSKVDRAIAQARGRAWIKKNIHIFFAIVWIQSSLLLLRYKIYHWSHNIEIF